MLVLTRKASQKIQIGPDITVTVISVKGRYVRLGIDAPEKFRILRTELTETPRPAAEPTGPTGGLPLTAPNVPIADGPMADGPRAAG